MAPPPAPALDTLTLAAAGTTVEIVPALGGKIARLHLAGRDWLWTSDVLERRAPEPSLADDDAASYVERADTGGYDECLPTVGACRVPDAVAGFGGVTLPDHGELWSQEGATERVRGADGAPSALTRWSGRRLPYAFTRTVTVTDDGAVRMEYALTSTGDAPLPFLWSAHPLLPLTPDTRLELPVAARVRVWAQHGIDLGGPGAEHRWPMVRVRSAPGGHDAERVRAMTDRFGPPELDLTRPARLGDGAACKLFLDLPRPTAGKLRLAVEQGAARLEVAVDAGEVPHLGLWINAGGWTPFAGARPYRNLAFEPCIGAGDTLDAALGAWRSAAWLAPGATRRWTLVWRGRRRPVGD